MNTITAPPQAPKPATAPPSLAALQRFVPLLVVLLVVGSILFSIAKILGYGYLPIDDVLRHAGKAVSGKPWDQIIVMRPEFNIDHNYGWHVLLTALHHRLNWDADALVSFSVASLFILFCVAPLPWMRRPEAWIAVLFGSGIYGSIMRMTFGRPLVLEAAVLLMILMLWREDDRAGLGRWVGTTLLLAASVFFHGAWYLFALPILAFLLAGRVRASLELCVCWLVGAFLGASLTGQPIAFMVQAVRIALACFGHHPLQRMLALEVQPSDGAFPFVVAVGFVLVLRHWSGRRASSVWKDPIFVLGALGWLLGLRVMRFWGDWGAPAMSLWMALELQEWMIAKWPNFSFARLGAAVFMAAGFFIAMTNDYGGRWTNSLRVEYLTPDKPELAGWLPEKGGILYSTDQQLFYLTFFKNPHAEWRYVLGYEPTFMLDEDLAVLRDVQLNHGESKAFMPWVAKMRPADRLAIPRDASNPPNIKELEWHYAGSGIWLGRLPRAPAVKPQ